MANTNGRRARQRKALERETLLSKSKGDIHDKLADMIDNKIRRRGEWKVKTKRSLTSAAARSKSKKGKGAGGGK